MPSRKTKSKCNPPQRDCSFALYLKRTSTLDELMFDLRSPDVKMTQYFDINYPSIMTFLQFKQMKPDIKGFFPSRIAENSLGQNQTYESFMLKG